MAAIVAMMFSKSVLSNESARYSIRARFVVLGRYCIQRVQLNAYKTLIVSE
jgi:hypothetical protein